MSRKKFRSTRLLRASTICRASYSRPGSYFDPRGSCEPRHPVDEIAPRHFYFDPRGSCEPRLFLTHSSSACCSFRSTRLLRASTYEIWRYTVGENISIHEALASLDTSLMATGRCRKDFDPRGSCEPRLSWAVPKGQDGYFDPRGSCEPRQYMIHNLKTVDMHFDPRGSCEPRPQAGISSKRKKVFRSTRLLRASTFPRGKLTDVWIISIHEALASLDLRTALHRRRQCDFDPRGSCEPRQMHWLKL